MNRLDIYKEFYQKEFERKNELGNSLTIPIGIISVLATGIYFYLSTFDFNTNRILTDIFILLLLAGTFYLLRSIYYLLRAYLVLQKKETPYAYLAFPESLEDYFQRFKLHYIGTGLSEKQAEQKSHLKLKEYLTERYCKTTTENMKINDERSANLFLCKKQILFSLGILLASFIPFVFNYFIKSEKNQKIEVVSGIKLNYDSLKIPVCIDCSCTTPQPGPVTSTSFPIPVIKKNQGKTLNCKCSYIYNLNYTNMTENDPNVPAQPPPPPPPPPPPDDRHINEGESAPRGKALNS